MGKSNKYSMAELDLTFVSSYAQFIESSAGLKELNLSAIFSFVVTKTGFEGLAKRKRSLLETLKGNNEKLEKWAKESELEPTSREMIFLRSMYRQTAVHIGIVEEHVERAGLLHRWSQLGLSLEDQHLEDDNDELPF